MYTCFILSYISAYIMLITRFINHIHVMYFLRAQYIGCYLFCPLSVNKMHSSSQASVHGCGSTSATPSDFLHFSRISVNFPLIAVPSTPFGVPGNFSKHAAVNKTRNYIQSIYAKILCILTLKQITVESTIMDKSRQQKPRISMTDYKIYGIVHQLRVHNTTFNSKC